MKKEIISYSIVGILTTLFNIGLFYFLTHIGMDYKISNLITLILVKIAAYIGNKRYVFHTTCENKKELGKECTKFFMGRLFTFLLDYFGVILLVEILQFEKLLSKVLVTILVVIVNYFISKYYVFQKETK